VVTPVLWLLFGGGVAALGYFGLKAFGKPAASPSLSLPGTGSSGSNSPAPSGAGSPLLDLLRGDATARKIYLFQAGMYSYMQTEALPDGRVGPVTRALIGKANQAANPMNTSQTFSNSTLQNLHTALLRLTGASDLAQASARIIPAAVSLPAALINQINREGVAVAVNVPLLQMFPKA
jgi:hypothetical protein